MHPSENHTLFADIPPEETANINGARRNCRPCGFRSTYPKSSEQHYHDTLRILYPDVVVVRYDYRRGTRVDLYYD